MNRAEVGRPPAPGPGGSPESALPWLFWDGTCGVCGRAVAWVKARGGGRCLRIIPYQEAPDPPMNETLRRRATRAVLVVFPDGAVLEGGRACLWVLEALGHRGTARLLRLPPFLQLVGGGYRLFAAARGRLFRRAGSGSCSPPRGT